MSAMTDDAVGFEPDAGLVPTEAKIARREMLRQLLRSKTFVVGVVVVLFWVFWALTGSAFTPHDPLEQTDAILKAPDSTYWFGTDQFGRDIFSRVLAGAQSTLRVAPAATVIAITLGTILGLIMGFVGGFTDEAISRLVDAILALPLIVIAVVVLTALGCSNITLIVVIGLIFTSPIAPGRFAPPCSVSASSTTSRRPSCAVSGRRTSCSSRSCPTSWGRSSSRRPYGSAMRSSRSPG